MWNKPVLIETTSSEHFSYIHDEN